MLAAFAGLALTLGALVSLAISRTGTLFEYSEPALRAGVTFAAIVELGVVLALAAFLVARRGQDQGSPRVDWSQTA